MLNEIKKAFKTVSHFKPSSSRAESVEWYMVAQGFKGAPDGFVSRRDSGDEDDGGYDPLG